MCCMNVYLMIEFEFLSVFCNGVVDLIWLVFVRVDVNFLKYFDVFFFGVRICEVSCYFCFLGFCENVLIEFDIC